MRALWVILVIASVSACRPPRTVAPLADGLFLEYERSYNGAPDGVYRLTFMSYEGKNSHLATFRIEGDYVGERPRNAGRVDLARLWVDSNMHDNQRKQSEAHKRRMRWTAPSGGRNPVTNARKKRRRQIRHKNRSLEPYPSTRQFGQIWLPPHLRKRNASTTRGVVKDLVPYKGRQAYRVVDVLESQPPEFYYDASSGFLVGARFEDGKEELELKDTNILALTAAGDG